MSDKFTSVALGYFGYSEPKQLLEMKLLQHVPEQDRIEVGVEFGLSLIKINDHCVDNFRVFPESMEEEHNKQALQGCCGSFDSKITVRSGNKYLFGFNYGH